MVSKLEIVAVYKYKRPYMKMNAENKPFNIISIRSQGECTFYYGDSKSVVDNKHLLIVPLGSEYIWETFGETLLTIQFKGSIPYSKITPLICSQTERSLFVEICDLYKKGTEHSICMAHSKLYALFGEIIYNASKGIGQNVISQGYDIIRMDFADPSFKIETLASSLNISSVYFRREFKKRYGMSPKEYLIRLRLDHAASLLINNYCNVNEAAYQSGFVNPNYFSVAFKNKFGMSPTDYSKLD